MKIINISLFALIFMAVQFGSAFANDNKAQQAATSPIAGFLTSTPIFSQIVVFNVPKGWKPAHEQASDRSYIMEFIPGDQKLGDWKEMITVQGFKDLAKNPNATPKGLIGMLATNIKKACGENTVGQLLGDKKIDSFEASYAFIGCANMSSVDIKGISNKGKSDIALYIAIKGTKDMYMIHRSIRSEAFNPKRIPVTQATLASWIKGLEPIKICERDSKFPTSGPQPCWERAAR